jgi:hypothetical protein
MRKPKSDWTDVLLAFRMILEPRKVWLAFNGVVLSIVAVAALLAALACAYQQFGAYPPAKPEADTWQAVRKGRVADAIVATRSFLCGLTARAAEEAETTLLARGAVPHQRIVALLSCRALNDLAIIGLAVAFVLLLIWSYYGAAIMRVAAVEYAIGERIELKSATAYAWRKHHCVYGPPLGLAIAIVVLGLCIWLAGLLGWNALILLAALVGLLAAGVAASVARDRTRSSRAGLAVGLAILVVLAAVLFAMDRFGLRIPYVGEVALGLFSPLAFFAGFVAVVTAIWLALGMPLMAGTIAASDAGAFDAWSRSFHYLFVHPWRYLAYLFVAAAHGSLCLAFVYLVRVATEWVTVLPLSIGPLLAVGSASEPLVDFFLALDHVLLDLLFLSFAAAYFFTVMTIVYFLLRHRSDGTPITEVHLEPRDQDRVKPAPAPRPS